MRKFIIKRQLSAILFVGIILILLYWSSEGAEVSIKNFIIGIPSMQEFLISMFPPNFLIFPKLMPRILETVQMAVISIILASIFGLPLAFLGAKNISPHPLVYRMTRLLLDFLRSVPTLLWALIFIAMVGLGSFPGVLGLTAHCIGTIGKYCSENIENIDPGVIEAAKAAGADRLQIVIFAVTPELKPLFLSNIFYFFEYCIRTASMLGIVGAGGIGMELLTHMRLFRYQESLAILIIIIAMVAGVDTASFLIRKRMIGLKK